ncbi:site-specific integrase [Catenuloplanes niger JCM 9533]
MSSYDVKIHDMGKRDDRGKSKSHRVRWVVAGKRFERSFTTKALADRFRSDLVKAAAAGEPFDELTGLPESKLREQDRTTWYDHARAYIEMKWPHAAAKSRKSMVDALLTVTPVLIVADRGAPDAETLRRALYRWAFNPNTRSESVPAAEEAALAWLSRQSLPVGRLRDTDHIRTALNACSRRLDGKPAAATTVQRKRAVFYNALGYAVERNLLDFNPIDRTQWKAPAVAEAVDRRVVANTAQVESLLDAVPAVHPQGAHLVAFFACLYFAGLRPSEAASLRRADCHLPESGWGRIDLAETAPPTGADWTDDGEVRQVRGLKHRAETEMRSVPIPPDLVRILRAHLAEFGTADDGRLFRAARGGYLVESTYGEIWRDARKAALTPEQAVSPLAGRPYDLRHAAVTLWLNGGVPATEVASRAGHGVAVLLKVYAGCIDGDEEHINQQIERAIKASRGRGRIRGNRPVNPARSKSKPQVASGKGSPKRSSLENH